MVNVPGRSKGCNTCRKRKIACSQERPACSQCIKSGRTCLGYSRQTIFVNSVMSPTSQELQGSRKGSPSSIKSVEAVSTPTSTPKVEQTSPATEKPFDFSQITMGTNDDLTRSLCNASTRTQLLAWSLTSHHEPNIRTWMQIVPLLPYPTKALESSAYAVSLAKLGAHMKDCRVIRESLRMYTQGLKRVQQALYDPELMYHDETLGACMFLALYEVFQCPSDARTAYLNHHNGCAKLIKLRGPERHTDGFAHAIFLGFRFMGTIQALESKATFLSEERWRTIPFLNRPKSAFDTVIDFMLEAPAILRDVNLLLVMPPAQQLRVAVDLLQTCINLEERMHTFLKEYEQSASQPLYWTTPSIESMLIQNKESKPEDPMIFPIAFYFPDNGSGMTLVYYWAILTMLWTGMCHVYSSIRALTTLTNDQNDHLVGYYPPTKDGPQAAFTFPPPTRCENFPEMAHNICQSVEFFMKDEMSFVGMTFPLKMVQDSLATFDKYDKEVEWITNQLLRIEKRGMRLVKHIMKI